jgi:hypothetical protein
VTLELHGLRSHDNQDKINGQQEVWKDPKGAPISQMLKIDEFLCLNHFKINVEVLPPSPSTSSTI